MFDPSSLSQPLPIDDMNIDAQAKEDFFGISPAPQAEDAPKKHLNMSYFGDNPPPAPPPPLRRPLPPPLHSAPPPPLRPLPPLPPIGGESVERPLPPPAQPYGVPGQGMGRMPVEPRAMPPQPNPIASRPQQAPQPQAGVQAARRATGREHGMAFMAVPIAVTLIIGGALYALQFGSMQKQLESMTAMKNQVEGELGALAGRIAKIEQNTENQEGDSLQSLKAQLAETASNLEAKIALLESGVSTVQNEEGMVSYVSRHGFRIAYPSYFHLDPFIEKYPTVSESQTSGENKFVLTNPSSEIEIKITVWLDGSMTKSLGEWINSLDDVSRVSDTTINGKPAEKVFRTLKDGTTNVSLYYVENGKGVVFSQNMKGSTFPDAFDAIVSSFKFMAPPVFGAPLTNSQS